MRHLDLFSGIGGFAYAVDQVWDNAEHIFCDNDKFCQQILKKHWPNSKIYEDIRTITNTISQRNGGEVGNSSSKKGKIQSREETQNARTYETWDGSAKPDLITGGFPCQPFSQAGRRKGTADDRYLWPEMLRLIRLTKPRWVIAENVAGLLTIGEGLVFEQVCLDLETEGYEVQPFVIPACAVNAPHRRDRVWFVANRKGINGKRSKPEGIRTRRSERQNRNESWNQNWLEVATELCRVDDGLSEGLDFAGWTKAQHRVQRLKALGNAIVPQVAIEIMKGIKIYENPELVAK